MDKFQYDASGNLHCEKIPVSQIIDKIGTPFYLYSLNSLKDHFLRFRQAFSALDPLLCFSLKSCNNIELVRELVALGAGIDTVSGGEIYFAQKAGVDMSKVVYAGIGKTDAEIAMGIDLDIGVFNIESEQEFENISRIAAEKGKTVTAALRVNPDVVDQKTHDKTKTGYRGSKFGVDIERAKKFFHQYGNDPHAHLKGIHIHIGSPIYSAEPYVLAISRILELTDYLSAEGFEVTVLDIGGGYPADYSDNLSPSWEDFASAIVPMLKPYVDKGVKIILEPGRTLAGNAAILVSKVNYIKQGGEKKFAILDTGMHHLVRPALYDAQHFIWPVKVAPQDIPHTRIINAGKDRFQTYDIVGPICESSDYLAKDRYLPHIKRGDYLAVFTVGAYGMVMASQYNAMPRPPEVMVDDDQLFLIKARESYEDLMTGYERTSIGL